MTNHTNVLTFDTAEISNSKGKGILALPTYEADIFAEPVEQIEGKKRPSHRVYGPAPKGSLIEIGQIWKNTNQSGDTFFVFKSKQLSVEAYLTKNRETDDEKIMTILLS